MKIIFTLHAEIQIKRRKLRKEEIIEAVERPENTKKKDDKYYADKKLERGRIEVVYQREKSFIMIITIYWI